MNLNDIEKGAQRIAPALPRSGQTAADRLVALCPPGAIRRAVAVLEEASRRRKRSTLTLAIEMDELGRVETVQVSPSEVYGWE